MTNHEIAQLRLAQQHIHHQHPLSSADVVRRLGAMQAQDYGQAVWGIGARIPGATLAQVEQAIADAHILRTWPQRGTIHFVPSADARWMLQLSAARMIAKDASRQAELGLSAEILARCENLAYDALAGRQQISRSGLLGIFQSAGIATHAGRGYHILWYLAHIGMICLGPTEAKEQTFVRLDEWTTSRSLSRDEALSELARRYFTSRGPATLHDFAWWSGLTMADARAGLEAAQRDLRSMDVEGNPYWLAQDATPVPNPPRLLLLCGFDEYLLGYKNRDAVLPLEHAHKICPGGNGVFFPMIVVDGQVVGVWKRSKKPKKVVITHEVFGAWGAEEAALFAEAAQHYADFLGLPLALA